MLVEIRPRQLVLEPVVVKHLVGQRLRQRIGDCLDVLPVLAGKRQSHMESFLLLSSDVIWHYSVLLESTVHQYAQVCGCLKA